MAVNSRGALSRRERDDLRAKIEASEAEEVLKEFVAAFEEPASKASKTFIKGGVFNPGSHEETPVDRGKSYRTSGSKSSRNSDSSSSSRDNLQQQIAKSNAAALAAAAAVSTPPDNKPVSKNMRIRNGGERIFC